MRKEPRLRRWQVGASEIVTGFVRRFPVASSSQTLPGLHRFLERMHQEIHRATRSQRPLTLVLLRLEAVEGRELQWPEVWSTVCARKRETDVCGHVGDHLAAVLLLDTGEAGAQTFLRDILRAHPMLTSIAQTYPDHLFFNLARSEEDVRL